MPISWTPDVEQRLFRVAMEVCGMNISGPQYDEMAERMGEGFTAEALKHRFRKFKKPAVQNGTPRKAAAPKAPKAAKTPKAAARKEKKGEEIAGGNDGDDGEEKTPRSSPRKRNAKNYAEPPSDDEEPESPTKKVKREENGESESFFDQDPEQV